MQAEIQKYLEGLFGNGRVVINKNISHFLTLKTQTLAEYYLEAQTRDDLLKVGKVRAGKRISMFILGGGSNVAILDPVIHGLVVRNIYQKREIINESDSEVDMLISSGYPISRLVSELTAEGLSGFEYHMGLPGTLGGALYMNSKWTNPVSYIGDNLLSANLVDEAGQEKKVNRDYFQFAYDTSVLQKTKEIVLESVFRLPRMSVDLLKQRAQDALTYRKETQPFGVATGGCFFRNVGEEVRSKLRLPSASAGYLIDHAGLKNLTVGGYKVSDKHANFIINTGTGSSEDLGRIVSIIKDRVKEKYGVELDEEVVIYKS